MTDFAVFHRVNDPTKKNFGKRVKTCEECFECYLEGDGETERGGRRAALTERFCSEFCANKYEDEIAEHEEGFQEDPCD